MPSMHSGGACRCFTAVQWLSVAWCVVDPFNGQYNISKCRFIDCRQQVRPVCCANASEHCFQKHGSFGWLAKFHKFCMKLLQL